MGLLFESAAGLRKFLGQRMEVDHGVAAPSFDVLIRLVRTPGHALRMSELAAQSSLSPSGLTRSVDRLAQQGLVRREACPEDRRGALAVLTLEGRALMARVVPDHVAQIDEVLSSVYTPEEELELSGLLRRLRDHLAEVNGEPSETGCPTLADTVDGGPPPAAAG
jgi:DNA-binding MarR family transcriptional regulator